MRERRINYLNWQEIKEIVPKKCDTVIWPVGTLEAHGTTSMGTDSLIPEKMSETLAQNLNCLIAPTLNYGITSSLLQYPGSLSLNPLTFKHLTSEILLGFIRTGFKKIIIMNGHGGQEDELKSAVTDIANSKHIKIVLVHWWYFTQNAAKAVYGTEEIAGHAGLEETAMILAFAPEAVRADLFNEKLIFSPHPGLKAVPAPGTILQDSNKALNPNYNPEKANQFAEKVTKEIEERISEILSLWQNSLND